MQIDALVKTINDPNAPVVYLIHGECAGDPVSFCHDTLFDAIDQYMHLLENDLVDSAEIKIVGRQENNVVPFPIQ